ncbi:MAG TPA: hypothetical protein VM938_06205 [Acidimicrobiales bacterium]|nr:hypothetical protein [Acidimicrobiales bacterium]
MWVGGPVPPGSDAVTLGSLVIVRRSAAGSAPLLRHEAVHVEQWRRHGIVGFLRRYLGDYLRLRLRGYGHRAAYWRIPFEVEAVWVGRDASRPLLAVTPPE